MKLSEQVVFTSISIERLEYIIQESIKKEFRRHSKQTAVGDNDLIKTPEACALLQVSKVTLYKWMEQGRIKGYKMGTRLYFKKSELLASVESKEDRTDQ